ncbi:hypothetical protein SeMB42_g01746 [Synchytrium endobioticum]|uniref:Alginate lyase domain-containing protein n=1 Tax=Synchytrium endobioticum TaxID=286115 RepID=A0A507CZ93_9FUNG|nr:hypothetical protein SeLEV6574_g04437 [Synchytrium endobioticum]TPX51965.1 hypothetical protein SeMB42_g01746 [Synchytrium endobioticum]
MVMPRIPIGILLVLILCHHVIAVSDFELEQYTQRLEDAQRIYAERTYQTIQYRKMYSPARALAISDDVTIEAMENRLLTGTPYSSEQLDVQPDYWMSESYMKFALQYHLVVLAAIHNIVCELTNILLAHDLAYPHQPLGLMTRHWLYSRLSEIVFKSMDAHLHYLSQYEMALGGTAYGLQESAISEHWQYAIASLKRYLLSEEQKLHSKLAHDGIVRIEDYVQPSYQLETFAAIPSAALGIDHLVLVTEYHRIKLGEAAAHAATFASVLRYWDISGLPIPNSRWNHIQWQYGSILQSMSYHEGMMFQCFQAMKKLARIEVGRIYDGTLHRHDRGGCSAGTPFSFGHDDIMRTHDGVDAGVTGENRHSLHTHDYSRSAGTRVMEYGGHITPATQRLHAPGHDVRGKSQSSSCIPPFFNWRIQEK